MRRMLEGRTVAVVGASERPGSFGWRMATEVLRSPGVERAWLVNPGRRRVLDQPCLPSLADVPDAVDLVLLGVPDHALVDQVRLASGRGDGGAVVFGPAHGLRDELVAAADGLEICGGGCMGFVNVVRGVRAIGYLEPDPVPAGPIALVTHSGSVFSALLRTHRRLEYSLAVSSGQELVTTTADHLAYALTLPETRVVGLVLETLRDAPAMRAVLADAAAHDVPVVALTVGTSTRGRALVDAHSGAVAGSDAAWEALFAAYGVHRADDLAELVDSLESFAVGRRVRRPGGGIATVHDSGAERVLASDVAERLGVPFAPLSPTTTERLAALLEPGLEPTNPLDVWGTGNDSEDVLADCLTTLADDPGVDVVALAIDLVPEYDGDESYPKALARLADHTDKPVVVLSNLSSAVDGPLAAALRARGIPVLEGTRSGLRALGHLLDHATRPTPPAADVDVVRQARWAARLRAGEVDPFALLADYGVPVARTLVVDDEAAAVAAAAEVGHPVVLKTADPDVHHKLEVDGIRLHLGDGAAVAAAYADLAGRLGPSVTVQPEVPTGVEVALGLWRDPLLGPLVLVAAGGSLVELLTERSVALPPMDADRAAGLVARLRLAELLAGYRGGAALASDALVDAVVAFGRLAHELGDLLEAVDVNPLVVGRDGVTAVDVLVVPRPA
ncbi:CoA-binding protein [Nocardioides guangzhouensis]|uniref:CoA-binding protein n=1 Tax=Nocardioides guangzhouensis TaxID=2497878 RepID=A0A4Q4ZIQ0_9ACTN|nr:CoA-binding protein [Nocardioides guangzhouensis]